MKLLKDLLYGVRIQEIVGNTQIAIESVCYDSRKSAKNALFVAISGTQVDGHDYIETALDAGAIAVVGEKIPAKTRAGIHYIQTKDSAFALSAVAANWFGNPSEEMTVIGVTGTNGKTTVATLLFNLFSELEGEVCGLLSTIAVRIGRATLPATHTTPDALAVQEHMRAMADAGVKYCFMEVSSHALVPHRDAHVDFDVAVFTNITRDHLDYHGDMNGYIAAKKILFDGLKSEAIALYNEDTKHGPTMISQTKAKVKSYALKFPADYKVKILERRFDGMLLTLNDQECWSRILGDFNAYNLCAIYAVGVELGKDPLQLLTAISLLKSVDGRFQTIQGKNITAVVDYAHTPDALQNVLSTINDLNQGRGKVITVVGCGGNRDKGKRPQMAAIAANESNKVILTSDNPRNEEPNAILADMEAGLSPDQKARTLTIEDRAQAIKSALMLAQTGDIILIAGKGHEKYQEIKGERTHFDDVEEVQNFLNN
ncbi:MAG: UDP-N-acetylmuramoyl-L-alanyl-D-glutamate--2,6-diaminopimelate ligase [Bacteroidetes bacterium]|nr:UDP-N-acetylmuramoyl-L-alanyl-D-glutamate--2,6-diaminopimelate ligase [Bacteroidota bacterium]